MDNLKFKISSGLKNIIGRELITDKVIAIFELVKNSYDAGATKVDISFKDIYTENATVEISDNGSGMNRQDIVDKWLFVAYSEKKKKRKLPHEESFRQARTYAGAKGVGRFSCDRLGSLLKLYSKKINEDDTNLLTVNWDDFEKDSQNEFINIDVGHQFVDKLPSKEKNGTTLIISNLREEWNRKDILDLKKSLIKLINPYENEEDVFEIFLHCDEEISNDSKKQDDKDKINGKLNNYVFETLNLKTTQIVAEISPDGEEITTTLYDRGIFLFKLIQKSEFWNLKNIKISLFYLNKAAKINFRKIMSVAPVEFGSIFIYKNGFRTMPYGEPGSDLFNIDRRKAQGYNRYLGTRDLMGRILILGDNPDFIETSSRDGGFIKTDAFDELKEFYHQYTHLPLEKYVVNLIKWGDETQSGQDAVNPMDIKNEITKYITSYEKKGKVISIDINDQLYEIIEENKPNKTTAVISEIKQIANQYQDKNLDKLVSKVETQTKKLKKDNIELIDLVDKTTEERDINKDKLEIVQRQNLFLSGLTNPKFENATESLHLMNTYAKSIGLNIKKVKSEVDKIENKDIADKIDKYIYEIVNAVKKIDGTYLFAFSADYDIKQQTQKIDLYEFIKQYIDNALFAKTGEFIKINVNNEATQYTVTLNPLEFSMIIENIIYNSYKAKAKILNINLSNEINQTVIKFIDDGIGLNNKVSNPDDVFNLGFSTTKGTGVGLSHAKKTIESWGGTINVVNSKQRGFELEMRLKYEY